MDFSPSEEQALLSDTFRRFFCDNADASGMGRGPLQPHEWRELAELGLVSLLLPERAGGLNGSLGDAATIAEEFGRALAITPLAEGIVAAADLIARHGGQDLIDRWVAPAIEGNPILALAEGSVEVEDGHRLAGMCPFVRWAPNAAALVVTVGNQAFVVAHDTPGLDIATITMIDGTPAGRVHLDRVAAEPVALPEGALATTLAAAQLCYVGEMVGAMVLLYEQTIEYVCQRKQFGVAISSFQVVQHKLARMFVVLEQARSLLLKAASRERNDPGLVRSVLAAKAYVARAAQSLAEDAVHLHGAIGITEELVVGRGLRRVTVLARLFGGAGEARALLAA